MTLHKFRSRLGYSQLNYYRNVYGNGIFKEKPVSANKNKKAVTKSFTDEKKILNVIKKHPGSKARKIASALGVEKKDVNHILYNNLKDVCKRDSEFNWYLKDDLDNKKKSKKQNIYSLLEKATKEHIAVYINYKGYGRVIHPYSVNSTYCVGFCTYRNGLRTFRIDRIREATLKNTFQPRNQYSNQASKKVDEAKHYRRY